MNEQKHHSSVLGKRVVVVRQGGLFDADLMQSIPAKFVVRTEPPPRILPHWVPLGSGHLLGIQLRDAQRGFQASVNLLQ